MAKENLEQTKKSVRLSVSQLLPYIYIIGGILGIIASFVLTYDKIQILMDPSYKPPCSINPVLSCGSVMKTEQANLLGVPNTIFGLVGFTSLVTIGFVLASGAMFKRWMWLIIQVGAIGGVIFMHYLFFQGVFRIGAICPWCFLVWMITIPIFWYTTVYNIRIRNFTIPKILKKPVNFLEANHIEILILWYAIILTILVQQFWYYWKTLI